MGDVPLDETLEVIIRDSITSNNELTVNSDGSINTAVFQGFPTRAVYSTTIPTLIPAANPTDVLVITGSATKTVRVLSIELYVSQNVAGNNNWLLFRRSTDDSGGTPVSLTPRLHDTTDGAATAAIREYLANPTVGTSAGIVARAQIVSFDSTTTVQNGFTFDFIKAGYDKGIVLRGTSEILALNFNAAALPAGMQITGTILHSEE